MSGPASPPKPCTESPSTGSGPRAVRPRSPPRVQRRATSRGNGALLQGKPRRGLTGFYVAMGVLLALGLLGAWLWTSWTNWQFDEPEAKRRQAEAARQLGVPVEKVVDLDGGVQLDLVLIPTGRFRMGIQAGREERGHQWLLLTTPFYIGKHEVTQAVWERVMGTNPSHFKGAKLPVEQVSWDDCQEFLKKLNELVPEPIPAPAGVGAGLKPAPTGGRYTFRLPTEAEWEWACRAGTRTGFCFGDADARLGEYAWHAANSGETTHTVGEKLPNAWGSTTATGTSGSGAVR